MLQKNQIEKGNLQWKCPSNIALVKYWGKQGKQLPSNASLSFSLTAAHTITSIDYEKKDQSAGISVDFLFEGKKNEAFARRILNYIQSIKDRIPVLNGMHLRISSRNSFPHSSGIASSASAFGALALALKDIDTILTGKEVYDENFYREASELARLGSGSASRSVYPGFTVWGKHEAIAYSSDQYAVQLNQDYIHRDFVSLKDSILIVSRSEKDVKSTAGHALMQGHTFAQTRFRQAQKNLGELVHALKNGDRGKFMDITENEAMSLHAMMMTSNPSYILLKPESLIIMEKIRSFRKQYAVPVCFTIDAGPNIHVVYPEDFESRVKDFIQSELLVYCDAKQWIDDGMGKGPEKLK